MSTVMSLRIRPTLPKAITLKTLTPLISMIWDME
jgi:hypothetical protein